MANLKTIVINTSGFIKIPAGSTQQRPNSPRGGALRYNTNENKTEFFDKSVWDLTPLERDGSSPETAAESGFALATNFPNLTSGYYWIQSGNMPNPLQMYVDMDEEGGGYDFFPIQNGTAVWKVFANAGGSGSPDHSGRELGLDIWYPRSKFHWRAATNFVRNVLGETGSDYQKYFRTAGAIHRNNGVIDGNGDGKSYTNQLLRNSNFYILPFTTATRGTSFNQINQGTRDWVVGDRGRWWLRDTTFGEPNGDYSSYGFLGISGSRVSTSTGAVVGSGSYTVPEPYNLQDISVNDISNNRDYSTGPFYLVSTNSKP